MAHEIDLSSGQAAIFTVGTPPWHGLGTCVEQAVCSEHAIRLAKLDWQVDQWPVLAADPNSPTTASAMNHVANVRQDNQTVLGIVSRQYQPFQNCDAFAFCDAVVGEGLARYETAGSLRGGRRVWMLLRLPNELRVGREDQLQPYLLVFNSHDGTSPLRAMLTTVRVVCANTLALAMRRSKGDGIRVHHRGDLRGRVDAARTTLGLARQRLREFETAAGAMSRLQMTSRSLKEYFDSLFTPITLTSSDKEKQNRERTLNQLNENFVNSRNSLAGIRGSLWAALNSATEFADHHRRVRSTLGVSRAEARLESIWFGSSAQFKQASYDNALALVPSTGT